MIRTGESPSSQAWLGRQPSRVPISAAPHEGERRSRRRSVNPDPSKPVSLLTESFPPPSTVLRPTVRFVRACTDGFNLY